MHSFQINFLLDAFWKQMFERGKYAFLNKSVELILFLSANRFTFTYTILHTNWSPVCFVFAYPFAWCRWIFYVKKQTNIESISHSLCWWCGHMHQIQICSLLFQYASLYMYGLFEHKYRHHKSSPSLVWPS